MSTNIEEEIESYEEIKDSLVLDIPTGNGQNSVGTPKLNGKLNCIIIQTDSKIDVTIKSELGYPILLKTIDGIEYIAPRTKTQPARQEQVMNMNQLDRFCLNESLDVIVSGQANSSVKLIFRLDI